jgi:radical SAM superfamily enzyme YgiQ (UPF0313 family)
MTSNRRWHAKSPERVISELETLRNTYGVEVVVFEDPIYFVDVRRVRRIAEMMIDRGLNLQWSATSRLETIRKIDDETWDVLKRSGFIQVFIGFESASPTVLKAIGKKYTTAEIVEAAKILYANDVILTGSFIQGIPVKSDTRTLEDISREDMRMSADAVLKIHLAHPGATIFVVLYTPYPGSVSYELSLENGLVPPTTLDGWQTFNHHNKVVPWVLREQEIFCATAQFAHKALKGWDKDRKRLHRKKIKGSILLAYSAVTRARYRHGYFKYPFEQHLMAKIAKRVIAARYADAQNNNMLI